MIKTLSVGEKVYKGYGGVAYTIEMIDGPNAVISGFGSKSIVPLSELRSIAHINSDGWYTFDHLPGKAYYVHWDQAGKPTLEWAFDFNSQKPEIAPSAPGFSVNPLTVFANEEFKPVKLTTQRV
jgi:hypothetical protein